MFSGARSCAVLPPRLRHLRAFCVLRLSLRLAASSSERFFSSSWRLRSTLRAFSFFNGESAFVAAEFVFQRQNLNGNVFHGRSDFFDTAPSST